MKERPSLDDLAKAALLYAEAVTAHVCMHGNVATFQLKLDDPSGKPVVMQWCARCGGLRKIVGSDSLPWQMPRSAA